MVQLLESNQTSKNSIGKTVNGRWVVGRRDISFLFNSSTPLHKKKTVKNHIQVNSNLKK